MALYPQLVRLNEASAARIVKNLRMSVSGDVSTSAIRNRAKNLRP
jgi:hypothetical protein